MRLLPLVALLLLALIIVLVIRVMRARKRKQALDKGWVVQQMDIGDTTHIRLARYGRHPKTEAIINFNDPFYSDKVIEAYAEAQVKADDRNSTIKAISEAS